MREIKKIAKKNHLNRGPSWLNQQVVLIVLVLLVLLTTLAWSKPFSNQPHREKQFLQSMESTVTVVDETLTTPTPSPLPDEWIQNSENTNDILLVGVLLVLIVVGGTYNAIRQTKKMQQHRDR